MPRVLSFTNRLLSLRGRVDITDAQGVTAYEAVGKLALFSQTWRVTRDQQELARVRRRLLSWLPTWDVRCGNDAFRIRRRFWSWTRRYWVDDGPYLGAEVQGNFIDRNFTVSWAGQTLARASGRILTLRDRHVVEVLDDANELFVVVAMLVLQLDRREGGGDSD